MNRNIMKELPPCLPLTVRTILRLPVLQGFSPPSVADQMSKACVLWSIEWTRSGSGARDDISFRSRSRGSRLLQDDAHTSLVSAPHAAFPPRHRTGASNAGRRRPRLRESNSSP